jgi:hypothetical protein
MKKVEILQACAGLDFAFQPGGEPVEVNGRNANFLDDMVRGGLARYVDEVKKKEVPESTGPDEGTDVLHDVPAEGAGRKRARKTGGG